MSFTVPIDFSAPLDFISYFEDLAMRHQEIPHLDGVKQAFAAFDPWQFEELSSYNLAFPAVLVAHEEGNVIDKKADNLIDNIDASFIIADQVTMNDFDEQNQVLNKCKTIGKDFIRRIREDKADGKVQGFLLDDLEYMKVGPMLDNKYGYQFNFTIQAPWSLIERDVWQA